MALPTTAPVVTCTLSKPLLAEGTAGVIKSAYLKIDRDLVWADTGETIYKESVPTVVQEGDGTLSFQVVPVDVSGMRDAAGASIQNWVYTLRVTLTLTSGVERSVDYVFQPLSADGDVDLDLVPHTNAVSEPPVPPITSVGVIDGGSL